MEANVCVLGLSISCCFAGHVEIRRGIVWRGRQEVEVSVLLVFRDLTLWKG